jgi:hypothetical protein
MPECSPPLRTKMPECSPSLRTYRIAQHNLKFVNTNSHLSGRPVLICTTSSPNSDFCLRTVRLINSPPKSLQVNEPTPSRNCFMTGHSTPKRHEDARICQLLSHWCIKARETMRSTVPAYPL